MVVTFITVLARVIALDHRDDRHHARARLQSLCSVSLSPPHVPRPPRAAPRAHAAPPQMMMFITIYAGDQSRLRWSGPTRTARRARRSRGRRGSAPPSCHSPRTPTAHAAHTTRAGTRCPSPCRGAEPLAACAPPPPPRRGPRRGGARPHAPAPCSRSRWRGQADRGKETVVGRVCHVSAERGGKRARACAVGRGGWRACGAWAVVAHGLLTIPRHACTHIHRQITYTDRCA